MISMTIALQKYEHVTSSLPPTTARNAPTVDKLGISELGDASLMYRSRQPMISGGKGMLGGVPMSRAPCNGSAPSINRHKLIQEDNSTGTPEAGTEPPAAYTHQGTSSHHSIGDIICSGELTWGLKPNNGANYLK